MSKDNLSPVWSRWFDVDIERGEGAYLYDTHGNRYLDFGSGIGVTNTGHAHPRIVKAVQDQAAKILHAQLGIGTGKAVLDLVDELKTILPSSLDTFFFSNSGAEAIEAAVKLAKAATGKPNIIAFEGGFHGRTHMAMALTMSKTGYRAGFQPLPSGVFAAPYANCYHCPVSARAMSHAERGALSASNPHDDGKCCNWAADRVRWILKTQTAPSETAAILVEPVLGEGGYVVPPISFLKELRQICDEHGILMILDEVQTGFGRTGKWFAMEYFDVVPDIVVMAKGLASGLPLSGIASRKELMAKWPTGSHGGTYGPNIVSAAAAVETIRVMRDEKLIENAAARGAQLMAGLRELQKDFHVIGDVRGLGCMVGTEFVDKDGNPASAVMQAIHKSLFDQKLITLTCGPYANVIRWVPPLVVTEQQIDDALHIFAAALDRVAP